MKRIKMIIFNRNIANGEILGTHLMLEDLLLYFNDVDEEIFKEGQPPLAITEIGEQNDDKKSEEDKKPVEEKPLKQDGENQVAFVLPEGVNPSRLSALLPLQNYARTHYFLISWKRLELLKADWARRKMLIESINDSVIYSKFA